MNVKKRKNEKLIEIAVKQACTWCKTSHVCTI